MIDLGHSRPIFVHFPSLPINFWSISVNFRALPINFVSIFGHFSVTSGHITVSSCPFPVTFGRLRLTFGSVHFWPFWVILSHLYSILFHSQSTFTQSWAISGQNLLSSRSATSHGQSISVTFGNSRSFLIASFQIPLYYLSLLFAYCQFQVLSGKSRSTSNYFTTTVWSLSKTFAELYITSGHFWCFLVTFVYFRSLPVNFLSSFCHFRSTSDNLRWTYVRLRLIFVWVPITLRYFKVKFPSLPVTFNHSS